mmetsp:Transcript_11079/g.33926  ORF Transcript_11079/g.33926 Transcript_11079/m.33926 type:complete len:213 (+) Transcript_11079:452-1090(+)
MRLRRKTSSPQSGHSRPLAVHEKRRPRIDARRFRWDRRALVILGLPSRRTSARRAGPTPRTDPTPRRERLMLRTRHEAATAECRERRDWSNSAAVVSTAAAEDTAAVAAAVSTAAAVNIAAAVNTAAAVAARYAQPQMELHRFDPPKTPDRVHERVHERILDLPDYHRRELTVAVTGHPAVVVVLSSEVKPCQHPTGAEAERKLVFVLATAQ